MAASDTRPTHTWEQAVAWLRHQQDRQDLVRLCYYDDPLLSAAERFATSDEWTGTRELLGGRVPGRVLEIGAGRGIASYAFARDGSRVTALEPDPSHLVGAGAISELVRLTGLSIEICRQWGEQLPFDSASFDVVFCRCVLHHARDLPAMCREISRVLVPGGCLLAVRDHVVESPNELATFLAAHPLHHLYGGENAFRLAEYVGAMRQAGLIVERVLGPFDHLVNYAPVMTEEQAEESISKALGRFLPRVLFRWGWLRSQFRRYRSRRDPTPGKVFSFLATKPNR